MQLRIWSTALRVLRACRLYVPERIGVPGAHSWQQRLKQWKVTMWLVRIWCTVWIAFGAFGVGNTTATIDVFRSVARIDILKQQPYSPPAYRSLLLATVWSMLAFSWNLLCCIIIPPLPSHLVLGVFDIIISIALGISQAELYEFIPVSNSTCFGGITRWNVPSDGQPNFYTVLGTNTGTEPSKACSGAVSAATWQAVIVGHEALVALLTIMLALPPDHLFSIYVLPGLPLRLATLVLREPIYVLHYVRGARRSGKARARTAKEVEMQAMKKKVVYHGPFTTKMEQVLALEEAVLVIASQLHYYDLVRLGWTNKRIRELVFPHGDLAIRRDKLKRVTRCVKGANTRCWNCNIQVCTGDETRNCGYLLGIGSDELGTIFRSRQSCSVEHHSTSCNAHCTLCYYTKICRNLFAANRKACTCLPLATGDSLCPNCVFLPESSQIRTEAVVKKVRKKAMEVKQCYDCGGRLKGNAVWWICGDCNKLCPDEVHAVNRCTARTERYAV